MATEMAVRARGVRKQYGSLWAVDGVDLDVAQGECVALLGPNGAGKTTFTEILEGYRSRSQGEVSVLGVDPARGGPHWKARIGCVLQSVRDLGELTVAEAVTHFAGYYPHPRDPDEVIAAVGLGEKQSARNDTLSGGQRRRLDVALGIVGRPDVLFLDEPTTGFDPEARRQFWRLIESIRGEGATILLTTHYLDEAQQLADRVAVISRGRVLACDTPGALGGRQAGQARVSWLEGAQTRSETTDTPTQLVRELSARFDFEIPELAIARPSLEDVYLEMIGHDSIGGDQ